MRVVLFGDGFAAMRGPLEPGDVERLVFSAQYGQLWLAKQTEDDTGPTSIITLSDVFEGP